MKHGALTLCLVALTLLGCEKAGQPANRVERQVEQKDQQSGTPPLAKWSTEFKDQTLKECIQGATKDMNPEGVRRCRCVIEKASTTIPEQKFKTIGTDPEVKALLKQIGSTC